MTRRKAHKATSNNTATQDLREAIRQRDDSLELLQERLAELELAMEDQGWTRIDAGAGDTHEFDRAALRSIGRMARLMYLKNPLIKRGVDVQTAYVFGQGVTIHGRAEAVNEVVQAFLDDAKNKAELTSHQARMLKEAELALFGNIFLVLFTNQTNGRVRVRSIPVDEVEDVITNPEDAKEPWYYKRCWRVRELEEASGEIKWVNRTAYYPDWRHRPQKARRPQAIGGQPVLWDSPVYHVKVGALSDMRFGLSEVYAALDWARAYKDFLEDWATIVRAYSRFAWKMTTQGGKRGVAAAKGKLGTTLGTGTGYAETNPSPTVGSTFIGAEGTNMEPIRTAGATTSAEDGRRMLLMVAATVGFPETFFGDSSVGTLATAKSLDRPTELKIRSRQTLWADIYRDILSYVIEQAVRALKGLLHDLGNVTDEDDGTPIITLDKDAAGKEMSADVDVLFPPILEHDITETINATISAATLNGQQPAGTMDLKTLSRLLLTSLGVDDIDAILDLLYPEGANIIPAPRQPAAAEAPARLQPQGEEGEADEEEAPAEQPAAEAMMVEAVRELRAALVEFGAKYAQAA
jgi:hypothetical protein